MTQATTRKRGMTNIKKALQLLQQKTKILLRWHQAREGGLLIGPLEPIINQGRKKEEKNIIQYDGIAPTPQRHTNTLTADRSKAINRRTRIRRQQSTTDTEITETTINDGHKGNNQRHRRTRRQQSTTDTEMDAETQ